MKPLLSLAALAYLAAAGAPPALAQQEAEPPGRPAPILAVKAARLFDGKSDALQPHGVVLVQGRQILAAGTDLAIPAGATVLDLGDATLAPGFIDAHTHLTGEATDDWKQHFVDQFRRGLAERAIQGAVQPPQGAGARLHPGPRGG